MVKPRTTGRRIDDKLRRTTEVVLLVASLVAGLAVVGSCASSGFSSGSGGFSVFGAIGGLFVAVVLVAAVYLFTTMSRDVRLLRDQYGESETVVADQRQPNEISSSANDDRL